MTGDAASNSGGALRALHVLEILAGMEQPASLSTIASTANLPKSMAYRALRALQNDGFVDHTGHSGYRLATRSLALASLIGPRPSLLRVALPVLRSLAGLAGETASLHLRSGAHRVLVLRADPPGQASRVPGMIGERAPLTSGCSGTVILSYLPTDEANEIIQSRPRREKRPSPASLVKIRRVGYAVSFNDNHVNLHGVAAPLLDPADGYPIGSVTIAGTPDRLPEAQLRELGRPLKQASADLGPKITRLLGPNSSERLAALDVTVQGPLEL